MQNRPCYQFTPTTIQTDPAIAAPHTPSTSRPIPETNTAHSRPHTTPKAPPTPPQYNAPRPTQGRAGRPAAAGLPLQGRQLLRGHGAAALGARQGGGAAVRVPAGTGLGADGWVAGHVGTWAEGWRGVRRQGVMETRLPAHEEEVSGRRAAWMYRWAMGGPTQLTAWREGALLAAQARARRVVGHVLLPLLLHGRAA